MVLSQVPLKKDVTEKKDLRIETWTQMTPKSKKPKTLQPKTEKDAATEMTPKKKEAKVPETIEIKEEPWPTPPPQASRATQWTPKSAGMQQNQPQRTPANDHPRNSELRSMFFKEAKKTIGEEENPLSMECSESPGGRVRVLIEKKGRIQSKSSFFHIDCFSSDGGKEPEVQVDSEAKHEEETSQLQFPN